MTVTKLHPWVRPITIAQVPGSRTPALDSAASALLDWLRDAGCAVTAQPDNATDVIFTTKCFGEIVDRDEALLYHSKRQYKLTRRPAVLTMVDIPEAEYQRWLAHFAELAQLPEAEAAQDQYPGLGSRAAEVISQQARRGGPEMAFSRLIQAQVLSIRVMALRTQGGCPYRAMHFDLAGAHPVTDATDLEAFAEEAGARVLTAICATEVNRHVNAGDPVPAETWAALTSPDAMVRAGVTFTEYGFFTTPIYVEKLLGYRGISDAISAQFSEGCYAIYEADIPGLLTTATGSSRLVDKRAISRADQAVVTGIRSERDGAIVRPVAGMEPVVPSVEAVEMMGICEGVPSHSHTNARGESLQVPNVRAILHGHLGVEAYDPERVESVMLDPLYYTQLVSCGTGALADGTAVAFGRSKSLCNPQDPRAVVFLEQPGHGVVVVEKWPAAGSAARPFETIHNYLAAGHLQMTLDIAQGPVHWEPVWSADGRRLMRRVTEREPAF
jgi:hypothetical protein